MKRNSDIFQETKFFDAMAMAKLIFLYPLTIRRAGFLRSLMNL